MHFHRRLGHLHYNTIIRMAKESGSGIALTAVNREKCQICAQGKQTKNRQSRRDTGNNSPIDVIVGVICSDLKGPMTPEDRLKNRYMVHFIDHRTNYCKVFLAKTKDAAAYKFNISWHFLSGSPIADFTFSERTKEASTISWICSAKKTVLRVR